MRKIIMTAAAVAMLTGMSVPAHATVRQSCTNPAVVSGGFVQLRCWPDIPANEFPVKTRCNHLDYWAMGSRKVTVNGVKYTVKERIREDIIICRG